MIVYSSLPITELRINSNQNRFSLDFRHTFTVILPSATRPLHNSNLPLTRSSFCFPSDHFYIILSSITRTMFWAFKSQEKTAYWRPKHWILNFTLTGCRHIVYYCRLMLFATNLTWNSFTSQNSKTHALFKQSFVMLCSDL